MTQIRTLDPGQQHPVYWALTSVCGVTDGEIRRRAPVASSVVYSARAGRNLRAQDVRAMLRVLEYQRDEMALHSSDRRDVHPLLRDYRKALFAVLSAICNQYGANPTPPAEDHLNADLIQAIGSGRRRDHVVSDMRRLGHSAVTVRRRAIKLMCPAVVVGTHVHWLPPANAPTPLFPPPRPTAVAPRSDRSRKLQDLISIFLGRSGGSAKAADVVAAMYEKGYSRPAVFKAARDMALTRVTTGFGPTKHAVWTLPERAIHD